MIQAASNIELINDKSSSTLSLVGNDNLIALKQQSDQLQHLLQVMPAGVIVLNQFGVITQVNELAKQLLGEPLQDQLWRHVIARSFSPKEDDGHEVSLKDGQRVKLSITPLVKEKGQLIVITDLSETRQLQDRISHLQRLSSLGKMVASLAHQIRTPLSSAMLYAANLESMPLNNDLATRFSNKLSCRLRDLESQVNDMLLFAKSGDSPIVSRLKISDITRAVVQSTETLFIQHQVTLAFDIVDESLFVIGNETAIVGAMGNLIHNALQVSTPEQTITIQVSTKITRDNCYVILSVVDQGKGIDEANKAKLFEPFHTTKSQGTGLGLAVVNSVAKSHKGFINAYNNKEGGATFELAIPISFDLQYNSKHTLQQQTEQAHEQN